jgi:hypothetical protein
MRCTASAPPLLVLIARSTSGDDEDVAVGQIDDVDGHAAGSLGT